MIVLDASALIAALFKEQGFERVTAKLPGACVSTLNLAEVFTRFIRDGHSTAAVLRRLAPLAIEPVPFSAAHAAEAAELWPLCRGAGLSLGDRACLALAIGRAMPVMTADRIWATLQLPVNVLLIR